MDCSFCKGVFAKAAMLVLIAVSTTFSECDFDNDGVAGSDIGCASIAIAVNAFRDNPVDAPPVKSVVLNLRIPPKEVTIEDHIDAWLLRFEGLKEDLSDGAVVHVLTDGLGDSDIKWRLAMALQLSGWNFEDGGDISIFTKKLKYCRLTGAGGAKTGCGCKHYEG